MEVIVRKATPADAEALVAYGTELSNEPDSNLKMSPGEFTYTVDSEREILQRYLDMQNSIFLVAEWQGEIIGMLSCEGGKHLVRRHTAHVSMSVKADYRGQGIGTQLVHAMLEWAKTSRAVTRIELGVFARNNAAIQLYKKFGFVEEGYCRKAVLRNGEYLDTIMMALFL